MYTGPVVWRRVIPDRHRSLHLQDVFSQHMASRRASIKLYKDWKLPLVHSNYNTVHVEGAYLATRRGETPLRNERRRRVTRALCLNRINYYDHNELNRRMNHMTMLFNLAETGREQRSGRSSVGQRSSSWFRGDAQASSSS